MHILKLLKKQTLSQLINTFEKMVNIDMSMKLPPGLVGIALASIAFSVPGGPKSIIPLHGCYNIIEYK